MFARCYYSYQQLICADISDEKAQYTHNVIHKGFTIRAYNSARIYLYIEHNNINYDVTSTNYGNFNDRKL